ncbi:hypothetical protein Tco_0735182 [Tanacetum coccineum]
MRAEYNIRERKRLNSVEAEAAEAIRLRTEASKFEAIEKSLQGEVRVLKDYNTTLEKEKSELDVKSHNDNLVDQVHELEISSARLQEKVTAYENCMGKLEEFQDEQIRVMNDKFKKWLLTYDVKLAIVKCLHSPEYLVLTDIAAINPSAEIDYISALQELQDVNFSLLAELKSNKDASTETLMNILHLDEPLIKRLGLDESQPYVDQLLSPSIIRRTELSALRDVFVPLVEPLSSADLEGMKSTSGTAPETTMALSVNFASTSSIPPISTDDYDVHADGQEGTDADG